MLPYVLGIVLSAGVALLGRSVGLDRDRAFYATVLIVVASYYVLFAAMGGSTSAVVAEVVAMSVFVLAAVAGFRRSPWILAAALAGHGLFDAIHGSLVTNPGVPAWWPAFCLSYDFGAGAFLAWILRGRAREALGGSGSGPSGWPRPLEVAALGPAEARRSRVGA